MKTLIDIVNNILQTRVGLTLLQRRILKIINVDIWKNIELKNILTLDFYVNGIEVKHYYSPKPILLTKVTYGEEGIPSLFLFPDESNIPNLLETNLLPKEERTLFELLLDIKKKMKPIMSKLGKIDYIKLYRDVNQLASIYKVFPLYVKVEFNEYLEEERRSYSILIAPHNGNAVISFEEYKDDVKIREQHVAYIPETNCMRLVINSSLIVDYKVGNGYEVKVNELNIPDEVIREIGQYVLTGLPKEIERIDVLKFIHKVIKLNTRTMALVISYIMIVNEFVRFLKENAEKYIFLIGKIVM